MKNITGFAFFLLIITACLSGRSFAGDINSIYIDISKVYYARERYLYIPEENIYVNSRFYLGENVGKGIEKEVNLQIYKISQYESWQSEKHGFSTNNNSIRTFINSNEPFRNYKRIAKFDKDHTANVKFIIEPLPIGTYRIAVTGDSCIAYDDVVVSHIGVLAKKDKNKILVYAQDMVSGEPVADATVKVGCSYSEASECGFGDTRLYYRGKTNADGLAEVSMKQLKNRDRNNSLVVIVSKDEDENYAYLTDKQETQFKAYIYTDRPVYRPGQTVKIKGIIRVLKNGEYVWKKGQKTVINIFDRDYKSVFHKITETDNFGNVFAEFHTDKSMNLGSCLIYMATKDGSEEAFFTLKEYRKPDLFFSAKTTGQIFASGENIYFDVEAMNSFGIPVVDTDIDYEIIAENNSFEWINKYLIKNINYYLLSYYGTGKVIEKGICKTDKNGKARLRIKAGKHEKNTVYNVSFKLVDGSRREYKSQMNVLVVKNKLFTRFYTYGRTLKPGDKVTSSLEVFDFNGKPVSTSFKLKIYKVETDQHHNIETKKLISSKDYETDFDGEARCDFVPDSSGRYIFESEVADPNGRIIVDSNTCDIEILTKSPEKSGSEAQDDETDKTYDYYSNSHISTIDKKAVYTTGDTAKFNISVPGDIRKVLVTVEGAELLYYYVLNVNGLKNEIEIPVTKYMKSDINICFSYFKENEIVQQSTCISTPEKDISLKLKITPDKSDYQPRESVSFKIEAKYNNNKPATAQVTMGIVDEAVFQLFKQNSSSETNDDSLQGRFRIKHSNGIQTANSKDYHDSADRNYYFDKIANEPLSNNEHMFDPNAGKICFYEIPSRYTAKSSGYSNDARFNFPDTCYFNPNIITDQNGKATVHFLLPDSLTTWQTRALAVTADSKFGEDMAKFTTSKKVMARLYTPRFLTDRDEAVITGVIHNYLDVEKNIAIELQAEGAEIISPVHRETVIASNGIVTVEWKVKVNKAGKAKFTLSAVTDKVSDAEERTIPVLVHGITKTETKSGKTDTSESIIFDLPETCEPDSLETTVSLYSSLSVVVFPALEYLVNYHYGCTEQTMSRFLPLLIVSRDYKNFKLTDRKIHEEMPAIIKEGLDRLYNYQHSDGGWGWWKHDNSSIWMTAYVVYGLSLAREMNFEIDSFSINDGKKWLNDHFQNASLNEKTYILYALSYAGDACSKRAAELFKMKDNMNNYSLALLAVILEKENMHNEALSVLKTLEKKALVKNDTVCWAGDGGDYGWSGNTNEITSFVLMAFIKIEPNNPISTRIMKYLLENLKEGHWYSTRDTAISIIAITDYIKTIEEPLTSFSVSLLANNGEAGSFEFGGTAQDGEPVKKIKIPARYLKKGKSEIFLQKSGTGRLYYSVSSTYCDSEENIKPVSNGFVVKREYFLIGPEKDEKGRDKLTLLKENPIVLKSQDQILVKLTVESKQTCQYMILEDPKPAGCEVLNSFNDHSWWYSGIEFRDEKTAFFMNNIYPGTTTYEYRMRAETPGTFHAIPAKAWMMYTPGMEGSSAESIFVIEEKK